MRILFYILLYLIAGVGLAYHWEIHRIRGGYERQRYYIFLEVTLWPVVLILCIGHVIWVPELFLFY